MEHLDRFSGDCVLPNKTTTQRTKPAKREGKSASTPAGEFARDEIKRVRRGKTWRPLREAGDRHRPISSPSRRCENATAQKKARRRCLRSKRPSTNGKRRTTPRRMKSALGRRHAHSERKERPLAGHEAMSRHVKSKRASGPLRNVAKSRGEPRRRD
jgi:hypothetical protein